MTPNQTLIQKADLEVANLVADGGYLQPATAKRFIQTLIDESTIMPQSTVKPMKSHTENIDKIRFAGRVLRAGTEGQALSQADRAKPDLDQEELKAQLFKAEVRLNNEVLEDSIEGGTLRQTVMKILGDRVALDMDEVIVNGDVTSVDPFLAKFDGIIIQASVNVFANGVAPPSRQTWKGMMKSMPSEFLRNKRRLRYFTSTDAEIEYRDSLMARATAQGDRHIETDATPLYNGVPIMDVPVFPEGLGVGLNETVSILTDPKNINVGIWRQIKMETDKDISAGVLIIVVSLRFDARFAEAKATVKGTEITVDN